MLFEGLYLGIDAIFRPAQFVGCCFGNRPRQREALIAGPACAEPTHQQIGQATRLFVTRAAFERRRADAEAIALDPGSVLFARVISTVKI